MVAAMNLKNPYTGELIRTKAEYDEAVAKKNAEQGEQALKKAGLSTELLQDIIKELPVVKEGAGSGREFQDRRGAGGARKGEARRRGGAPEIPSWTRRFKASRTSRRCPIKRRSGASW
jgi:hypothetical protein